MKVLGIDIGTAITGWAIMERAKGKYIPYGYGAIRTSKNSKMPDRLGEIYEDLNEVINTYKPTVMAVEDLFFFKNQKTVISVGQARGVVILAGQQNGLEVFDYTPLQVKQAVAGYGRADKKQVQEMVKHILNLKEVPQPDDVADALAVAICHLNTLIN